MPQFDVYISEIVLGEIRATAESNDRKALEALIEEFKLLRVNEDTIEFAKIYLSCRHLPQGDALHLALASIGGMDFLVTWNLRHLYKRGTQEMIRETNMRLRIPIPTIVTPEDFLGEQVIQDETDD